MKFPHSLAALTLDRQRSAHVLGTLNIFFVRTLSFLLGFDACYSLAACAYLLLLFEIPIYLIYPYALLALSLIYLFVIWNGRFCNLMYHGQSSTMSSMKLQLLLARVPG